MAYRPRMMSNVHWSIRLWLNAVLACLFQSDLSPHLCYFLSSPSCYSRGMAPIGKAWSIYMDECGCDTPIHESIVQVIDGRLDEALVCHSKMSSITPNREGGEDIVLSARKCSKIKLRASATAPQAPPLAASGPAHNFPSFGAAIPDCSLIPECWCHHSRLPAAAYTHAKKSPCPSQIHDAPIGHQKYGTPCRQTWSYADIQHRKRAKPLKRNAHPVNPSNCHANSSPRLHAHFWCCWWKWNDNELAVASCR